MYIFYIFSLIILLWIIFYLYRETTKIKIEKVKIYSTKTSNKFKILQLSDLHFKKIGKKEKQIIKIVNKKNFDLLVLTGDYLLEEKYFNDFAEFIHKLNIDKPAYAVPGNHEILIQIDKLKKLFEKEGINLLLNESKTININDEEINIIGVENPDAPYFKAQDFKNIIKSLDTLRKYNLVLSHKYDIVEYINKTQSIDLVLAGDTHGGQINLPFISNIFFQKISKIKYLEGKHKINDTILYINRGIGTSLFPIRYNSRPEITILEVE